MSSPQQLTPQERFDRYVALQRQHATTERQLEELKTLLKQDLDSGTVLENETHFAQMRESRAVSYDVQRFAQTFGPDILLSVCTVEKRKVDDLAKRGVLDELRLLGIQTVKYRTPALMIRERTDQE